jgi:hypothetical protein
MPITRRSITDAGFFDSAVSLMAARGIQRIRGTERWYLTARDTWKSRLGTLKGGQIAAANAVWESARQAVNAATTARERGGTLPGPGRAPNQTDPETRGGRTVEYHVIVKYHDPVTGGKNSVPVFVSRDTPITLAALESLAAVLGTTEDFWSTTGKRGEIDRDTAVHVETVLIGISSR